MSFQRKLESICILAQDRWIPAFAGMTIVHYGWSIVVG